MPEKYAIMSSTIGNSIKDAYIYDKVYLIRNDESLSEALKSIAAKSSSVVLLNVYAHGKIARDHWYTWRESGGYGAYLGYENIKLENAHLWKVLKGKFHQNGIINMNVCNFADTSNPANSSKYGPATFQYDGLAMCKAIARNAGVRLRASPDFQAFTYTAKNLNFLEDLADTLNLASYPANYYELDFGAWEGTTYVFDPNGRDVRQE
ncbi:hypothetical protein EJV46_01045 [Roseococcus sp. SYP-B2431]|uniref:hypothetical protein n=1 Tax=Roseococcus sp. SYP-B2431 TaxID=2496640 RepID=UPI0010400CC7|nr:hypothetical protein [Roseococcus sp. SYP-B2431]TCI00759.1 hypothetical protein EJV46_01045 [Roseococcus sp. SYP-B2431]